MTPKTDPNIRKIIKLEKEIKSLNEALEKKDADIHWLNKCIQVVEGSLQVVEGSLHAKDELIKALQTALATRKEHIQMLKNRIAYIEGKVPMPETSFSKN